MRKILANRGLRLIFAANMISMIGSGMNSAAVTWYLLQTTGTEIALGWLLVLQTIPAMALMPLSGVMIDREDRRHIVMMLDAGRGLIILLIAVLALMHRVQVWQLYAMAILVAIGFWMFWPTVTALIQELTPETDFVHSNTFLMAGVQGGWVLAGAFVGFVYNHIGLGGVLLIDFFTYVASFSCYLFVRHGRHVVHHPMREEIVEVEHSVARYFHEMREGLRYVRQRKFLVLLATSWAMFLGGMLTNSVITAPLSDRILHAGAEGYGWLNMGWATGAVISVFFTAWTVRKIGARSTIAITMLAIALAWYIAPFIPILAVGVALYSIGGAARGMAGVALSSTLMETVPKHFMGRVQNTIYFAGTSLQLFLGLSVGVVAHRIGLALAFAMVATVYFAGFVAALIPAEPITITRADATNA
ncbi:MAG TPA: MFS transporter [Terriglobales bacterium]|nr:MFS transporter [Terriglobales bacterium]